MVQKLPITVVIPTLNESWQIAEAMDALSWADEVIVADGGSTDDTVTIARERGAKVMEVTGTTIAGQRNAAIAVARNEWVLALDADERVTDDLRPGIFVLRASAPTASAARTSTSATSDVAASGAATGTSGCSGGSNASWRTAYTSGWSPSPTPAPCAARSAISPTAT